MSGNVGQSGDARPDCSAIGVSSRLSEPPTLARMNPRATGIPEATSSRRPRARVVQLQSDGTSPVQTICIICGICG